MGFFFGHFHQPPSDEGGVLWEASFDAVILACVERHADEEEECRCHDAKLAVFVGVGGLEQEEQEGEDGAAEDEQNHDVHVADKKIRPNHAQGEGDDEANKSVVLPVHQRLFNSLILSSGFAEPNT